jgi:hypothetical protein
MSGNNPSAVLTHEAGHVVIVHAPVLDRVASATYVARRTATEWFVGGPGFLDADQAAFCRMAFHELAQLDPTLANLADLLVGWHGFRGGANDPWERGLIPAGSTFLLTYEVRPAKILPGREDVGGAIVNCWIVADSMSRAKALADQALRDDEWVVIDRMKEEQRDEDNVAEVAEQYFRQAQIDGVVLVFHTYPASEVVQN